MLAGMKNIARRALNRTRAPDPRPAARGWCSRDEVIMGTAVRVELWSDERAAGADAMAAVMAEMDRIDRLMSPYKPESELSRINSDAAAQAVPVSAELFDLIARSIDFSVLSEGAFDITFASAGHLYDYRRQVRPSDEELARARAAIGYRNLILDASMHTVRFARAGVRIDLGGFAKGHAVDRGAAILQRRGISHAIVSAGGDSRILGDRQGRPWTIGIRDPRQAGDVIAVLPLQDVALSTSGDYERYFEEGGVRFHHVLDPRTGKSPSGVRSVTVIAADGLTSEALTKTVFVLGVARGMALVESQPGVDAVVIDGEGALHYSRGLRDGRLPSWQ
jgi:thiamine biosynthesis lipoprotein